MTVDDVPTHFDQFFGQIHVCHDLIPFFVNLDPLLVDHVVVFQHVFPTVEVGTFLAFLGIFHGFGKHSGRNGFIVGEGIDQRHICQFFAPEQTKQIVFKGNIERRFAHIALTTGTPPQLVVDPAGFVTLGTDNIKTAGGFHFFCLCVHLGFKLGMKFFVARPGVENRLVVGFGKGSGLNDQFVLKFFLFHLLFRHIFGVTAQDNVGTAPRHVGGDGNGTLPSRLSDDRRFLFMVFGVQHVVGDLVGS